MMIAYLLTYFFILIHSFKLFEISQLIYFSRDVSKSDDEKSMQK